MDEIIVILLVVEIILAAINFYLGFVNPPRVFRHWPKGAFFSLTFMLIPFTVFVLWGQSTAVDRLAREGVVPHPAITHSVGISQDILNNGTWVFKADTTPAEVLSFYMEEDNRPGWELTTKSPPVFCMFKKDGRSLTIAASRKWSSDQTTIMYRIK